VPETFVQKSTGTAGEKQKEVPAHAALWLIKEAESLLSRMDQPKEADDNGDEAGERHGLQCLFHLAIVVLSCRPA